MLSHLAWAVVSMVSRTIAIRTVNRDLVDRLTAERRNCIYAFWHGSMFLLLQAHRGSGIAIMASESKDGAIMASILRLFGYTTVRGSSKRKGNKALLNLVHIIRAGGSAAIAVDGPRGPRHEVKPGIVFLAGKLKVPIVPVASVARRAWSMEKSWDALMVPAPFTQGVILYGEPIIVGGTTDEDIESGRARLEEALHSLNREARELVAIGEVEAQNSVLDAFSSRHTHRTP
jgi:lysophospholipid acyltransferase (LPLAT)-like uncharacterized protein